MFQSTTAENFRSWDRFLAAYYEPIEAALALLPFVGPDRADDVANDFFLKLYERDLLANRPAITGRFRDWLYVAARDHAPDDWRKRHRRRERADAFEADGPVDPRSAAVEAGAFDADECYALSILHLTVGRVRKHLLQEGKAEHWMIFEELALAPLVPGRAAGAWGLPGPARQPVSLRGAGDQPHHAVPRAEAAGVGRTDGQDHGDARREGDPVREPGRDGELPGRPADRRDREGRRQPPRPEPAGDPPGDQEDRDGRDGRRQVEQGHERRRRVERDVPPPPRLAEGDECPEPECRDGRRPGRGPREAPDGRPREVRDDGQRDGVHDGPDDDLLCCHGDLRRAGDRARTAHHPRLAGPVSGGPHLGPVRPGADGLAPTR